MTADIYVEEGHWWIFALDSLIEFVCDIVPSVPFPKAKLRLTNPDDIEFYGSEWTTWKDWYGDLNQYFHLLVHDPVFNYCQGKMISKSVAITFDQAKEIFYESDKKFWDEQAAICNEIHTQADN